MPTYGSHPSIGRPIDRRRVALLIETSSGYCRGLLEGISAFVRTRGTWSVHLREQERGAAPPKWLKAWRGDGIIARVETVGIGVQLRRLRIPIVDLSAARYLPGIPWADTEDRAIAKLAVEHFLDRGFHHLAFCGDAGFAWSLSRGEHFCNLAREAGCAVFDHRTTHRYSPKYQWDKVRDRLIAWLLGLPRPVAILACNDYQAQMVLDVCRSESIAVPEEAAVMGVDDDRLMCEFCEPQLSSVIPDTFRTGFEAAELLERMMNHEQVDSQARLVTQPLGIRLRASTDTIAIGDAEVARALSYIRRHALKNIRVSDVLKQGSISRRALEHRFVKAVGRTPHEEIVQIRVAHIKQLLDNTEDRIVDIAARTGFDHPEYFTAAFRKETGMTPTEYRRRSERCSELGEVENGHEANFQQAARTLPIQHRFQPS